VARETTVALSSDWPDPGFIGAFLPTDRDINPANFSARWQVPHLARSVPQAWSLENQGLLVLSAYKFGVRFVVPVDFYQVVSRAAKYAMMFLATAFMAVFVLELRSAHAVHPAQYMLVGLAMAFFYVLLLSFAEQIGFLWAYLIAAIATVGLISTYVGRVQRSASKGFVMLAVLALLYGLLYMILQLEDYALFLLHGPVDACAVLIRQPIEAASRGERGRHTGASRELTHVPLKRGFQSEIVQHGRAKPERQVANSPHDLIHEGAALRQRLGETLTDGRAHAFDPAQLHAQPGQHLADMVVQFARQMPAFLFLRRHDLRRQRTRMAFCGLRHPPLLLRAPLQHTQPVHGDDRHECAQQQALPQDHPKVRAVLTVLAGDFLPFQIQIGVVQPFDLEGQRHGCLAPRQNFAPEKPTPLAQRPGRRPGEQGFKGLPIPVEVRLERHQAINLFRPGFQQRPKVVQRGGVGPAELRQALPVLLVASRLGIEEVVSDEDPRQVQIRPKTAQRGLHLTMVRIQRIKPRVDFIRLPRAGHAKDRDECQ
jgi:hypothetical protein